MRLDRRARPWRIDGVCVYRKPRLFGTLPTDEKLTCPDTRAHWQRRIDEELMTQVYVHPFERPREPWMFTMGQLRGTWGWGLILWPRYNRTDYGAFVDMVIATIGAPLQLAWAKDSYDSRGATLLRGFRLPTNMEMDAT